MNDLPDLSCLPFDVYAIICDNLSMRDVHALAATSNTIRNMILGVKFDVSRLRELHDVPEPLHCATADKQLRAYAIRICVKARPGVKTDIVRFCQAFNLRGYVRLSGIESKEGENFFMYSIDTRSPCFNFPLNAHSSFSLDIIAQGFGLQRLCGQLRTMAHDNKLRDLQEITHGPRYHYFRIHKSRDVDDAAALLVDRLSKGDYAERGYRISDIHAFPLRMQDESSNTSSNLAHLEKAVENLGRQMHEQARRQEEQAEELARRQEEQAEELARRLEEQAREQAKELARRLEEQAREQAKELARRLEEQAKELARRNEEQLQGLTSMLAALLKASNPGSLTSSAPAKEEKEEKEKEK